MKDDKDLNKEHVTEPDDNESKNSSQAAEDSSKSTISADLIRGHINTIILRTLDERDKYGYEIMNEIEEKSHGQYTLKQPTLYSALKRLENQGYIKAYWKTDEVSSGGRRKYFTLTELGREYSEKNQSEWEYSRTVIDSLISDRSFDFSQPAPTPVDFNILKKSVSRVYTGNGKGEDGDGDGREEKHETPPDERSEYAKKYAEIESSPVKDEYSGQTVADMYVERPALPSERNESANNTEDAAVHEDAATAAPANAQAAQPAADTQQYGSGNIQPAQPVTGPESIQQTGQPVYPNQPISEQQFINQQAQAVPGQAYAGNGAGQPIYPAQGYVPYGGDAYTGQPYVQQMYGQPGYAADQYNGAYPTYSQSQAYQQAAQPVDTQPTRQSEPQIKRDLFATQPIPSQPEDSRSDEEKRAAHENFLRLIAEQDSKERGTVPNSDAIDTQKLIYTNRPETERDYKKLVDNIYKKAIKTSSSEPQPQTPPQTEPAEAPQAEQPIQNVHYSYAADTAYEKARADGLKINTSSAVGARGKSAKSTTFNKGAALFASSVIVGIIILIEFVVCISLMQPLGINIMYPVTLLIIALVQLGVFGALFACGYGKGSIRPASHGYISLCVVLTVISILIICLVSFLLNVNLQSWTDIAIKIVIPSVTALNITIFGISYYFISK